MQARGVRAVARATAVCEPAAQSSPAHSVDALATVEPAFRKVVARAAARFRPSGRGPCYFARGKLSGDPVFASLLRDGRIPDGTRIVDIGCGLGVLAALLAESERCDPRAESQWPHAWAPPPKRWTLHGVDLHPRAITAAQRAHLDLIDRVSFAVADMRTAPLPACDVVAILDVLHYIDRAEQLALLQRAISALAPSGTLLLRVADAAPTWRFRLTLVGDWLTAFPRGMRWPRFYCRSVTEWKTLLEAIGFSVSTQPMSHGTPFANVLLIATKRSEPNAI